MDFFFNSIITFLCHSLHNSKDTTFPPNHAVLIVGFGTKKGENGKPDEDYWIVRNSHGSGWGHKGDVSFLFHIFDFFQIIL